WFGTRNRREPDCRRSNAQDRRRPTVRAAPRLARRRMLRARRPKAPIPRTARPPAYTAPHLPSPLTRAPRWTPHAGGLIDQFGRCVAPGGSASRLGTALRRSLSPKATADPSCDFRHRDGRGRAVPPSLIFDAAFLQAAVADCNSMRNADQLEVSKHHARPFAAIIEQHFDTGGGKSVMQIVGRPTNGVAAIVADRRDGDGERRQRLRPDDAFGVVVLLDRGGNHTRDANAVASHLHDLRLALSIEIT